MIRIALVAWLLLAPVAVRAEPGRYALVVGHDLGHDDDHPLRYAETDARRFGEVLVDVGGFRPENVLILPGPTSDAFQAALIALNDRIRTLGEPALLVVYYSGHADAIALHLGRESLPLERLEQLVRGSSASFRLLVVDACRSGALTRVKGGSVVPAPPLRLREELPADGVVFWTSSSANEDAQESDELGGSFFTHHLISGLLGAADSNGDGGVTLGEAYPYAYEEALRASSRTLAGVQHATFRHETHGLADVTLTWLTVRTRGTLELPAGRDYLIFRGSAGGPVVAEVGAHRGERRISLRPGTYFVRGRASGYLLEGKAVVSASQRTAVDEGGLERVEYARLVRKGVGGRERADRLELGYTIRSSLWSDAGPCQGLIAGWAVDLRAFSVGVRGVVCRGGVENDFLGATHDQVGVESRLVHAWDVGGVTLSAGALAGGSLLRQHFVDAEMAPARNSIAGTAGVTAGLSFDLARRVYATLELDGVTSFFRGQEGEETALRARFSVRGNALVGWRW